MVSAVQVPHALAALAAATLLAGCSAASSTPAASPTRTATASPSVTASPSPSPTPSLRTSPLTGLPEATPAPVLVVKLDNTRNAQPHAGLAEADVVYLEEVEYGITRIAAVFSGSIPERIGPVRSARITDLDLLSQYGTPAFVYSGAQRKLRPAIAASTLIERSPAQLASAFWRDRDRYAPYNLFINGAKVIKSAPDASVDHDLGWVFATETPAGGTPTTKASMKWSWAKASFTYDDQTGRYRVSLNGERARAEENDLGQNADTVIIQLVEQQPSKYFDKGGGNTPHAETIGSGDAIVMRDGQSWNVRWSRPSKDVGTTFTMADGSPMPFKPGQQWIVLLNERTPPKLHGQAAASPTASSSASPPGGLATGPTASGIAITPTATARAAGSSPTATAR